MPTRGEPTLYFTGDVSREISGILQQATDTPRDIITERHRLQFWVAYVGIPPAIPMSSIGVSLLCRSAIIRDCYHFLKPRICSRRARTLLMCVEPHPTLPFPLRTKGITSALEKEAHLEKKTAQLAAVRPC
jgi:hypothetical protein